MAYNNRSEYPKKYQQIVNLDTTGTDIHSLEGTAFTHFVIANTDTVTRTVAFGDIAVVLLNVNVLPSTSKVVPGFRLGKANTLTIFDNDSDVAGVYVTAFWSE